MSRYLGWLEERQGRRFSDYASLWQWSVDDLEGFWASIWDYFNIKAHTPYRCVLESREMPGVKWFTGARLNYAEQVFRYRDDADGVAIYYKREGGDLRTLSRRDLEERTRLAANSLKALGVGVGDRVAAYLPNIPEAAIAFLACASIGAVWTSCSPDFGTPTVLDRFAQIKPKILIAVDGYAYNGKKYDRRSVIRELREALPTVTHTIFLPNLDPSAEPGEAGDDCLIWDEFLAGRPGDSEQLEFTPVDFNHPLWILYSSGTTGLPKAIVHSQGGVLLEHLKALSLHLDIGPGSRFFWFTTTGWVMWNMLMGGLLTGASIVMYDGNPGYPDMGELWRLAEEARITYFGAGAAYLGSCMKAGLKPGRDFDLGHVRSVGSTGSPLSIDAFRWCYEAIGSDIWLASSSGGTDVAGGFVGGIPLVPVYAGEIQGRMLGARVEAYNDNGKPVIGEIGEMVISAPMPSMPLYFWGDDDFVRYRESYFDMFPGVWRHGDFLEITDRGTCIIYGRSDSTLNRYGVRTGTAEVYRIVEGVPGVRDSLIVNLDRPGGEFYMPLFVVMADGQQLTDEIRSEINLRLRKDLSPRHVPDAIVAVAAIPYTLTGKKMEVPVRRILAGAAPDGVLNRDAMANPAAIEPFLRIARQMQDA